MISNYNDYEFNGSITARVYVDSQEIGSEGDIVAAFIDNDLRGISFTDSVPVQLGGGYIFNIMVFNNESSGSIINFIYYNNNNDALACLDETLEFTSDMIYGNALTPLFLTLLRIGFLLKFSLKHLIFILLIQIHLIL